MTTSIKNMSLYNPDLVSDSIVPFSPYKLNKNKAW